MQTYDTNSLLLYIDTEKKKEENSFVPFSVDLRLEEIQ